MPSPPGPAAAAAAGSADPWSQGPRMIVRGRAPSHQDIAAFAERLARQAGIRDLRVNRTTATPELGSSAIEFEIVAQLMLAPEPAR